MTKKDYENIARAIVSTAWNCDNQDQPLSETQYEEMIKTFSYMLKMGNVRFDEAKFFKACALSNYGHESN